MINGVIIASLSSHYRLALASAAAARKVALLFSPTRFENVTSHAVKNGTENHTLQEVSQSELNAGIVIELAGTISK